MNQKKYACGGIYEEMIKVTPKDLDNLYEENIKNGVPILILYGEDLTTIKKYLSMFKENYLDKKKKSNFSKIGKDKFKGNYIKLPISQKMAKNTKIFEFISEGKGEKSVKKTNQRAIIYKDIYDFDFLEKIVLKCLKGDFFEKNIDLRKYGIKK